MASTKPNILYVFADQWRAQATGYAGNSIVQTPHINQLAAESLNFTHAMAGCPVCCPARASLLTGQYPLTHGVFVNDVHLGDEATSIAQAFTAGGYHTAYVGKWHVNGRGRSAYIPPENQLGFQYWKALECTHDYNNSYYYAGAMPKKLLWEDYDAIAQTRDVQAYLRQHPQDKPFFLMLSWGPPHAPYDTAPERYRAMYKPEDIPLRPNVPADQADQARKWLAGYYAHCTALDDCLGDLRRTLAETGLAENTILVFTSDHGDMLGSQGQRKKQRPWDESIRVPFLLSHPAQFGLEGRQVPALLDTADIMPTLLSLCDLPIPDSVEGLNYADYLRGGPNPSDDAVLINCPHPFGQWLIHEGGREYRGLRTHRYTYVRDLGCPWLLYDNEKDPYQLENRINHPDYAAIQSTLDARLQAKLKARQDDFKPGLHYLERWGYVVDETGTVPYVW